MSRDVRLQQLQRSLHVDQSRRRQDGGPRDRSAMHVAKACIRWAISFHIAGGGLHMTDGAQTMRTERWHASLSGNVQ